MAEAHRVTALRLSIYICPAQGGRFCPMVFKGNPQAGQDPQSCKVLCLFCAPGTCQYVPKAYHSMCLQPTSFRCCELLDFTPGPISSPIDYNHLQFVVAVRKQLGHCTPWSVSKKTCVLPFSGDPQVLQQTTFSPVIGLQEIGITSEAFPIQSENGFH